MLSKVPRIWDTKESPSSLYESRLYTSVRVIPVFRVQTHLAKVPKGYYPWGLTISFSYAPPRHIYRSKYHISPPPVSRICGKTALQCSPAADASGKTLNSGGMPSSSSRRMHSGTVLPQMRPQGRWDDRKGRETTGGSFCPSSGQGGRVRAEFVQRRKRDREARGKPDYSS